MKKTKRTPRRLKILRALAILILAPVMFVLALIVLISLFGNSPAERFEKAKDRCQDELWIVRDDSPFTHVEEIKNPQSRSVGTLRSKSVLRYACSQEEARQQQASIHEAENRYYIPMLIVIAVYMYGSPVFMGIVLWWLVEELKHRRR